MDNCITTEIFSAIVGMLTTQCFQYELVEALKRIGYTCSNFSINEQDYSVLLRYFSFGLHRLKSYRVRFKQEKNTLFASN